MTKIVWGSYPISRVVTRNAGLPMALEWNFERNGEILQVATRSARTTGEYVVASRYAGRTLRTERYTRYSEYVARVLALDHRLAEQHWTHVDVRETSAG